MKYSSRLISLMLTFILIFCACAGQPAAPDWQEQYDLGVRYLSEGNYQEAIIAFNAAIEINPRQADAYLGLADAYVGIGDTDSAIAALREGYDLTGDERLRERLEELNPPKQTEQEAPPAEITVLLSQQAHLNPGINEFYSGLIFSVNYEYNEDGYLVRGERIYTYDPEKPDVQVDTYEYDETGKRWRAYQNGEAIGRGFDEVRKRGNDRYMLGVLCLSGNPYPGDDHPSTVENARPMTDVNFKEDWAYAEYEYNEAGNVARVTSYGASGTQLGYFQMEWAKLILGPDGTYTMQ